MWTYWNAAMIAGMTSSARNRPASVARYERGIWLFALAFAMLLSHELDAMIRSEWELLPGLNSLDSDTAADVFNLLHVPLLAPIIWVLTAGSITARRRTMIGVEVFLVVHAVAHTLLRGADRYEFQPPVETITVYGAAVASAIHLTFLKTWSPAERPSA